MGISIARRWTVSIGLVMLLAVMSGVYSANWANPASASTGTTTTSYSDAETLGGVGNAVASDSASSFNVSSFSDVILPASTGASTGYEVAHHNVDDKTARTLTNITVTATSSDSGCVAITAQGTTTHTDGDFTTHSFSSEVKSLDCSTTVTFTGKQDNANPQDTSFKITVNPAPPVEPESTSFFIEYEIKELEGKFVDALSSNLETTNGEGSATKVASYSELTGVNFKFFELEVGNHLGSSIDIKPQVSSTGSAAVGASATLGSGIKCGETDSKLNKTLYVGESELVTDCLLLEKKTTFENYKSVPSRSIKLRLYSIDFTNNVNASYLSADAEEIILNPPAEVCIGYSDEDLAAAYGGPDGLIIARAVDGELVPMSTKVDTFNSTACAFTSREGLFMLALAEEPVDENAVALLPVTGGFTPNGGTLLVSMIVGGVLVAAGLRLARRSASRRTAV